MGALILALQQIVHQSEGIIVKHYGKKYGSGGSFFNAVICFFAMIFFFITDKNGLTFTKELILYGLISCILYATGFYTAYVAYQTGPFMLTRLLTSFSGIISIVYGIAILKEPAGFFTYLGIFLVFVCIFLMRYQKSSPIDKKRKKKFSPLWLISVILVVSSNGLIGVISRSQQLKFNHAYDNEFMILSFGGATVALIIFELLREGTSFLNTIKYSSLYGMLAGFCNGAKSFLNLLLYLYIPISVATPLKTGLGFVVSFLISVIFYKEKFSKMQLIGVIIGIVAMVMFKL